jgi:hypothetical protein
MSVLSMSVKGTTQIRAKMHANEENVNFAMARLIAQTKHVPEDAVAILMRCLNIHTLEMATLIYRSWFCTEPQSLKNGNNKNSV